MKTIAVDLLNDNAINILKDLEILNVIKLHDDFEASPESSVAKYKGLMTKQSLEEVDQQLNELRKGWD